MSKTEGKIAGEFILCESPYAASREAVTILSGQNLDVGAVLGRVALGIGRASIPAVVGTGNGLMSLVFAGPDVEEGDYVITCKTKVTNAGVFSVVAPSGKALPDATVAVAYISSHINFSIADGSTDFEVGDVFTIVVGTTAPTVIGGTGTGVMTALSLSPDAKPGRYQVINRVVVTNGGDFEVLGPDGESIGRFIWTNAGSTASFTSRQINFTLSDATDYIAGNYFDVAVYNKGERDKGKGVAWAPGTYDGRNKVAGILIAAVDASAADKAGVMLARKAVVKGDELTFGAAISAAEKQVAKSEMARVLDIFSRAS